MAVEYIPFGEPYPDLAADRLVQQVARRMLAVCRASKDFEVIELRRFERPDGKVSDIIVVNCIDDQVPSRNPVGIKVRERLALTFTIDQIPEVRALRKDFPIVPHLNHVPSGQPKSLCLYFEPWSTAERVWTPQKYLRRILLWLSETAKGTLHRDDQPVERVYFNSPLGVVLPPDFDDKIKELPLTFFAVMQSNGGFKVIRGFFQSKGQTKTHDIPHTDVLMLELSPIVHGNIEHYPSTLGQVHDQLEGRGAPFLTDLQDLIRRKTPQCGLCHKPSDRCLLVFTIPIKRASDLPPESNEVCAFLLINDLAMLGEATGALTPHEGKLYAILSIGQTVSDETKAWRDIEVQPVDVRREADRVFARIASGVYETTADFKGVIAGVGALGSQIVDLWSKESWGEWILIDPDTVEAHNIVRHAAKNHQIGHYKVDAVKDAVAANYHNGYYTFEVIHDSVMSSATKTREAIASTALLVDATTTIDVPRELSQCEDMPRAVSVFLTPSGLNSVLLFESADRRVRLDALEAQYYRSIIRSDWGASHLAGHNSTVWVGAGCRDVSAIISNESIQLHAAVIARQVRLLRDKPEPRICIWSAEPETGSLLATDIPVQAKMHAMGGEWKVIWDAGVYEQLCSMRNAHLPNETGGIVLGYVDHKLKSIYIVDALSAPPDSASDPTGFTRGVEGLAASLKEVARRTANIVDYIGEWHSHPSFASAYPSSLDRALIETLANKLAIEGQPALMIIVGRTGEMSVSVKEE